MALSSAPASGPSLRSLQTAAREAMPRPLRVEDKDAFAFFSTVCHAIAPRMGEGRTERSRRESARTQLLEPKPGAHKPPQFKRDWLVRVTGNEAETNHS